MKLKTKKARRIPAKGIKEKNVALFAQKTAKYAIKKATRENVAVTVAKAGRIYRLHPDGKKEVISRLPDKIKVKQPVIKIAD